MNTEKRQEMESSSQRSAMQTRKLNRGACRYPSAVRTQGGSSGEKRNEFSNCSNIGDLDKGKIKCILDIVIDITRFDIDLVSSCLKSETHKSAITELENLRHAIESIWRLLWVDVKLVDCLKDKQQLLHPDHSPSLSQSKGCQQQDDCIIPKNRDVVEQLLQSPQNLLFGDKNVGQGVLEEFIKPELTELDTNDTIEDDYMQTPEGDYEESQIEEGNDDDVTSPHQEPSNNPSEDGSLLNKDVSSIPDISVPPICTNLYQPVENSGCVVEQLELPYDVEVEISNSADVQILSQVNVTELSPTHTQALNNIKNEEMLYQVNAEKKLSLDHSYTTNITEDGQKLSQVNVDKEWPPDHSQAPNNMGDGQIISFVNADRKLSLDHSQTTKNTVDGKMQSSRTDDMGRNSGVHQPEHVAGIMTEHTEPLSVCESDDRVVVKNETHIPSTDQDSEVTLEGTSSDTQEKADKLLAMKRRRVPKCSAISCNNTQANRPDLKFLRFPLDMMRCINWVISCKRIDLAGKRSEFLHQNHFLCSLHFEKEQLSDGSGVDQLVPSIFSFPADATGNSNPTSFAEEAVKEIHPKCSAIGCKNSKRKRPEYQFFRFPLDNIRCMKWILNCRRFDLVGKSSEYLNQNHFLCPLHFEKKKLSVGPMSDQFVPSRFTFPVKPTIASSSSSITKGGQQQSLSVQGVLKTQMQKTPALKQKTPTRKQKTPALKRKTAVALVSLSTMTQKLPLTQESLASIIQDPQSSLALSSSVTSLQPPNALAASSLDQEQMKVLLTNPETGQQTPVTLIVKKNKTSLDKENPGLISPKVEKVASTGPFPCEKCSKVYTHERALRRHRKIHDTVKTLTCELCGEMFTKKRELKRHEKAIHFQLHTCDRCGRRVRNLKNHLRDHAEFDSGILHSCGVCKKQFSLKKYLYAHMRTHKQKSHLCALCGKCFTLKYSLDMHVRSHTGEKKFSCKVCSKSFALQGNLSRHNRIHTGERPYQCGLCQKRFATSTTLKAHQRAHRRETPFKCTICNAAFNVSTRLIFHRFKFHGLNELNGLGKKPYECTKCGIKLPLKTCLSYHLKFQCGDVPPDPRRFRENRPWSSKCPVCSEIFFSNRLRKSHMELAHPEYGHKCNICGKAVANISNMIRHHREVHEGHRPFKCEICGRSFKQKGSLDLHLWTHRSDKRYKCELCGIGYNDKRNIVSHMKKVHDYNSDDSLYLVLNEPAREECVLAADNLWK